MKTTALAFALVAALAGCGANSDMYLISSDVTQTKVRVATRSVEVKEVSLPAYAAASEIAYQTAEGALKTAKGVLWAEEPSAAVTRIIAEQLDAGTTAQVAAEPWPLLDSPDTTLDLRIDRMVARADGQFELAGQYAISSFSSGRDKLRRFTILQPITDTAPATIAAATGAALAELSQEIAQELR